MPKLEDPFREQYCTNRVMGMGQAQSWKHAWKACRENGMKSRGDDDYAPMPAGESREIPILPRWPETDKEVSKYAAELDKRSYVIDRKHELLQNYRAQELPDKISYGFVTLQEIIARCMQAVPVRTPEGKDLGQYTFNPSGANAAVKIMFSGIKLQSEIGDVNAGQDSVKDIEKKLNALYKELGIVRPRTQGSITEGIGDASASEADSDSPVPPLQ